MLTCFSTSFCLHFQQAKGTLRVFYKWTVITDFMRKANAAGVEVHQILFPYSGHDFNTTYNSITNQAMRQIIAQFIIDRQAGPKLPGLTFTD